MESDENDDDDEEERGTYRGRLGMEERDES